jgi:hypothetical protein
VKLVVLDTPQDTAPCPVCGKPPTLDYGEEDEFDRAGKRIPGAKRYSVFHMGDRHYVGLYKGTSADEVLSAWNKIFKDKRDI